MSSTIRSRPTPMRSISCARLQGSRQGRDRRPSPPLGRRRRTTRRSRTRNSYHCNLPPELERAKIEALTEAIEAGFGARPTIFKAGRYGFGPNTRQGAGRARLRGRLQLRPPYRPLRRRRPRFPRRARTCRTGSTKARAARSAAHRRLFRRDGRAWAAAPPGCSTTAAPSGCASPACSPAAGLVARSRLTPEGHAARPSNAA